MPERRIRTLHPWARARKKEMADALRSFRIAKDRIGVTERDQLRWLLAFVERDAGKLHDLEVAAIGWDLRALASTHTPKGFRPYMALIQPMAEGQVRALQAAIKAGLKEVLSGGHWELPATTGIVFRSAGSRKKRPEFGIWSKADERTEIIWAAANLVVKCGTQIRSCAECSTVFVAERRQIYCSERCSQRVRNRRRGIAHS